MKLYGLIVAFIAASTDNTTNKGEVQTRVFDDLDTLHSMAVAMKGGENSSTLRNLVTKKKSDFSMSDFEDIFDAVRNITKSNVESTVTTSRTTITGYMDDIEDCFKDYSYASTEANSYKTEYDAADGEKTTADGLISVYETANTTECEDVVSSCSTRDTEGLALYDAMVTSIGCSEPSVPGPDINYDENFVFKSANTIASDIKTKHTNWKNAKETCSTETTKCNTASNNLNEANTNASNACAALEAKKVAGMNAYDGCFDPKLGSINGFSAATTFSTLQSQILALETLICTIYPAVEVLLDTDDTTNTMPNGGNIACALAGRGGLDVDEALGGLLQTSVATVTKPRRALMHQARSNSQKFKSRMRSEIMAYMNRTEAGHGIAPDEMSQSELEAEVGRLLVYIGATTQEAVDSWTGDDYRNSMISYSVSFIGMPPQFFQGRRDSEILNMCGLFQSMTCAENFGYDIGDPPDLDDLRNTVITILNVETGESVSDLQGKLDFELSVECRSLTTPTDAPTNDLTTLAPDYESGPQTTEAPVTDPRITPLGSKASFTDTGDYVCTCTADGETLYQSTYDFHVDNFTIPTKDATWTTLGCDVGENDGDGGDGGDDTTGGGCEPSVDTPDGCSNQYTFRMGREGVDVVCGNPTSEGWTCTGLSEPVYLKYVDWYSQRWILDRNVFGDGFISPWGKAKGGVCPPTEGWDNEITYVCGP